MINTYKLSSCSIVNLMMPQRNVEVISVETDRCSVDNNKVLPFHYRVRKAWHIR